MSGAVEGVALLPCPFCDGEAASDVYAGTGRIFYTIGCNNDLCAASCHFTGYEGLEPLIPLWNTRTTPPARSYADEDVARIIDPYAWRCYDATLQPFQENRGAHEGESWHVRAYQAGCRSADDASQWWRETANDIEPHTVQQFRDSLAKAATIRLLSQGEKA